MPPADDRRRALPGHRGRALGRPARRLPKWRAAYRFFRRWRDNDYTKELYGRLRKMLRELAGKKEEPTAAIIDSQSVKADATVGAATRGYDAGKKINGRKRHIAVDTLGLLLAVIVTAASVKDNDAGRDLLEQLRAEHHRITLVWADGAYTGWLVTFAHAVLTLADRRQAQRRRQGFVVLPRRWVVERSFSWLIRARRLARDYETRIDSAEAMAWWPRASRPPAAWPAPADQHRAASSGPRPEQPWPPLGQPAPLDQPLRPKPRCLLPRITG
ncbi:IS5 family transposase [Streptacidiphilus sp. 4-A2]|nr:IS5 family transposase [Streptacidiphilus sp. 4-A2]